MVKILANDGIHPAGKELLEKSGYEVHTEKIPQEILITNLSDYQVLLVRSATKVTEEVLKANPQLQLIGRGGVGLDNIDLKAAEKHGVKVFNTPAASSQSVAELAFGHMFNLSRFLHLSNREMPQSGSSSFKLLKKSYAGGVELFGKKLGIIGFGRIGQEVARIGLGLGMEILAVDPAVNDTHIQIEIFKLPKEDYPSIQIKTISMDQMVREADFISIHVPSIDKPIIGKDELRAMKKSAVLINTSRGGVIDENALLSALENGEIRGAGLDVFENEPSPLKKLLTHPKISVSPHIGASTAEAQKRIGLELVDQIVAFFDKN